MAKVFLQIAPITLCRSSLAAQEGRQARLFSGDRFTRPRGSESYPVGYSVALTAFQNGEAKATFEATVEKSDAFELEDGEFELEKESLVTIANVNLGDVHRIAFAKDDKGMDTTIVEITVNELKE